MLSQLKSYLFGATDGVMMEEPASEGECKTNGEDDWVLVDTQGKWVYNNKFVVQYSYGLFWYKL